MQCVGTNRNPLSMILRLETDSLAENASRWTSSSSRRLRTAGRAHGRTPLHGYEPARKGKSPIGGSRQTWEPYDGQHLLVDHSNPTVAGQRCRLLRSHETYQKRAGATDLRRVLASRVHFRRMQRNDNHTYIDIY